jgi:NADPH:quinone reductase-like Zn-dependent oxidoreductase
MKAIVYKEYGDPGVLHIRELQKPLPKPNEILIKVRAVEATKADCELRSFNFPVKWFWIPLRLAMGITKPRKSVLGAYFAGEVEAIGEGVVKFKPGDEVFGATQFLFGAYAEYLCLPDNCTVVSCRD